MVRFDLFLHFRLDLLKIVRRNPVREIDIIIKAVIDRRSGRELGSWPDLQNCRRQNVRSRMAQALDVAHRCSHLRSFAFLRHNSERCLDYARHDKKPGRAQLNDEDARCLSSARGSREFCGLLASYWAVKLTTKNTKDTENFALLFGLRDACDLGSAGC